MSQLLLRKNDLFLKQYVRPARTVLHPEIYDVGIKIPLHRKMGDISCHDRDFLWKLHVHKSVYYN